MIRTSTAFATLLVLTACGPEGREPAAAAGSAFEDPEVARVYNRMMSVIAPDGGWERARYLEFDRASAGGSVRRHRWDRWEGRARVEAEANGAIMVALFDTDDPTAGRIWLDGEEVTGEEAESRLTGAYRSHINDGYWLLMPFKWADPGVNARYLGERTDEAGRIWEVVELSFDEGTGLTPRNLYHAFVNPETGRMERWHHFSNPDSDPSPSEWGDWRRVGPIELAETRRSGGELRSSFPHLRVETSVPQGALDPPSP